jgi:hypothetical protein
MHKKIPPDKLSFPAKNEKSPPILILIARYVTKILLTNNKNYVTFVILHSIQRCIIIAKRDENWFKLDLPGQSLL